MPVKKRDYARHAAEEVVRIWPDGWAQRQLEYGNVLVRSHRQRRQDKEPRSLTMVNTAIGLIPAAVMILACVLLWGWGAQRRAERSNSMVMQLGRAMQGQTAEPSPTATPSPYVGEEVWVTDQYQTFLSHLVTTTPVPSPTSTLIGGSSGQPGLLPTGMIGVAP